MPFTYFITGCSRGLGLALAVELSKRGDFVFATARGDPTPALQELVSNSSGRVEYLKLDVTNRSNAEEAAKHVEASGKSIDVLINNAGVINETSNRLDAMNDLDSTFNSNVTSAHIVTSAFLSLLRKGTQKKVVNISTAAGSIAMASKYSTVAPPAYKVSKAALNMLTAQYAQSYEKEGFTFIAVSPGRLRTDMGGESGDLDVETGAKAVLEVVDSNGKESNGKFLNIRVSGWEQAEGGIQYDGKIIPW